MHRLRTTMAGLAMGLLLGATALGAQGRERAQEPVPKAYEPPRGMCRVWLEGVPPAQQPAPTDCATAIRRRPENARVIFGESVRDPRETRRDTARAGERGRASPPVRELRPRTPPPSRSEPRSRRPPSPPPDHEAYDDEERLALATALDLELLDRLYGPAPGDRSRDALRTSDGRASPRPRVGERGRQRSAAPLPPAERVLEWASDADGRPLLAWEVERLLLEERRYAAAPGPYADGSNPTWGLVDARPGECYDRDFDGRCDDLAGGADGCFDTNRDGRCDDARWDAPGADHRAADRRDPRDPRAGREPRGAPYGLCFDRDRDGRCDEPWSDGRRIPQTLPEMAAAAGLRRGVASYDVERWLRRTDLQSRITDRDGDGIPERVTWLDPAGRLVQLWTDRDGDGIADRVELFRDGVPVQVIGR